jgi:hypothetical protein
MSDIVQISSLGKNGRWGNSLFQYCFARTYAERVGARLETPSWLGQTLFGLSDPDISCVLPQLHESAISGSPADWVPNVDLVGWFQVRRLMACGSHREARKWLAFKPEWLARFPKPFPEYAACHLRQGDFFTSAGDPYCLIGEESYLRAVKKFVPINCPVIVVEEDGAKPRSDLPADLQFLPDFLVLMQADILFRANSTFSWWAAELGTCRTVYSPVVGTLTGHHDVEFVLGNAEQHVNLPGYGKLKFGRD